MNVSLQELRLNRAEIGLDGAKALAACVAGLRALDLDSNNWVTLALRRWRSTTCECVPSEAEPHAEWDRRCRGDGCGHFTWRMRRTSSGS